eukprot:4284764-Karenia_brevis.AAC.1
MQPTGLSPIMAKVALGVQEPQLSAADFVAPAAEVRAAAKQAGQTPEEDAQKDVSNIGPEAAAGTAREVPAAAHSADTNPGLEDSQHDGFPGEGEEPLGDETGKVLEQPANEEDKEQEQQITQ